VRGAARLGRITRERESAFGAMRAGAVGTAARGRQVSWNAARLDCNRCGAVVSSITQPCVLRPRVQLNSAVCSAPARNRTRFSERLPPLLRTKWYATTAGRRVRIRPRNLMVAGHSAMMSTRAAVKAPAAGSRVSMDRDTIWPQAGVPTPDNSASVMSHLVAENMHAPLEQHR
jgi:hypothetical protein